MRSNKVNYYVFEEIWNLLERLQLIHGIPFHELDVSALDDQLTIINRYIRPSYEAICEAKKDLIRNSFKYYMRTRSAPFSTLRARSQELLMNHEDSQLFLESVGRVLFGDNYLDDFVVENYVEVLDKKEARLLFDGMPNET